MPPGVPSYYRWFPGYYQWYCRCPGAGCPQCATQLAYIVMMPDVSIAVLIYSRCVDYCVRPTATPAPPGPTATPASPWPCNEPPVVDDAGILRQPCSQWPGWFIQAQVIIPPAAALVNPWPRSLCGLETSFWYAGASDVEQFSADKALACSGISYSATYTQPTYHCGNPPQYAGVVREGARVNYQIGVAWRQWKRGEGAIFGRYPLDEAVWTIPDREWNGGMKVFGVGKNERLGYTFETSSWIPGEGMTPGQQDYCAEHDCESGIALGPQWNSYCDDHDCRCSERVSDPLGSPAYAVALTTFWWPEYTFRFDEYYCVHWRSWCEVRPGWGTAACDADGDGVNDPDTVGHLECDQWKWRNKTEPLGCSTINPKTGWCMYDLRQLGRDPLVTSNKVTVAGAFPDGSRCAPGNVDCCPWYDRWPYYVPVPVIEIQPVKYP